MAYVTTANACNEPNSETPLSASAISAQDSAVAAVGQQFINGNAAVYNLVAQLGGNQPGMVPGAPPASVAPVATVNGSPVTSNPVVTYAAPGVQAAPPGPIAVPPSLIGGTRTPTGRYLGNSVKSMVAGCNPPWAGPTLGAQTQASAPATNGNSWLWFWGLGLLAVTIYAVGAESK